MAIRRFNDYEKTKSYTEFERLPKGDMCSLSRVQRFVRIESDST